MAGIGFELNKLFKEKGLSSKVKAIGYSGIVVAGPLVLGIALVFIISSIAAYYGLSENDRMLLIAMLTYAIMASLFLTGIISLPFTRYVSDRLYVHEDRKIIPSYYGGLAVILPLGIVVYLIFLLQSKLGVTVTVLNLMLFVLLSCIWLMSNYLSAIKDYRGIMLSYVVAIVAAVISIFVLHTIFGSKFWIFLMGCVIGYGCQFIFSINLLYDFFISARRGAFEFLPYMKKYFSLSFIGMLSEVRTASPFWYGLLHWDIYFPCCKLPQSQTLYIES